MKKISSWLAIAGLFIPSYVHAISLDDIQLWTGSGTNRAALVIEWNSPEVFNQTSVSAPVATKTLVWGYRFNGTATGTQMLEAIAAADPKLYVAASDTYGTFITGVGYNLSGNGVIGITDNSSTNYFTNGFAWDGSVNPDAAAPLNQGDLFWSGYYGPNWQVWTELGDAGGFLTSPNRGTNAFATYDPDSYTYTQGQWTSSYGLDDSLLSNGSWIGFSVSADGYPDDSTDPAYSTNLTINSDDEQSPPSPDGTYVAYVSNTNDFAVQIISTNNIDPNSPYNDPTAVLNRPTLKFYDPYDGNVTDRVSIIDDPFNVTPDGAKVITEISSGGQITVQLGRKIYNDPNNPYGTDLIIYGNSFFSASGYSGSVSDATDLSTATLGTGIFGHATIVSVSQDGTNWYTYNTTSTLFPDNAYRWDDTNAIWTDEQMNPNKPLNPFVYTNTVSQSVASALDQFTGAAGGTGYDLAASGLPWIQYVRIQPGAGVYTVIDAIAAVNPVSVGDALSIAPDNLASGITNLAFQSPNDPGQNQIVINFNSVNEIAKISTVSLNEFSAFAPVIGNVSSAYQIQSRPVTGTNAVVFLANVGLRAGENYSGSGNDLRVYQWNCTNWISRPFNFNSTNQEVSVAGITNFSAFVVSQIVPPRLNIATITNGLAFQFVPVPNCPSTLERSTNLVTWTTISTFTATNAQPVTLQDSNAPAGNAFYRLQLNP